jgi:hypothetical protein
VWWVVHGNAAITLLGWARYCSRGRWMPYHQQVAGVPWRELRPTLQLLFLTMSRTASTACALCALGAVALFRGGTRTARRHALQLLLALYGAIGVAAWHLHRASGHKANTPWKVCLLSVASILGALKLEARDDATHF